MKRFSKLFFLAAAAGAAMTNVALADEAKPDETAPTPPPDGSMPAPAVKVDATAATGMPGLTVPKGKILIAGSTLVINMSTDAVGKPITLAPSVSYGVSDDLTVGLTHDGGNTMWNPRPGLRTITIANPLVTGESITAAAGAGICLTGEENGCNKFYDNVGVDALFNVAKGKFSAAVHGGVDVFSIDQGTLTLRAGLLGRYDLGPKMALAFDPRITVPLTDRDVLGEAIDIPVHFWYMANDKLSVFGSSGIAGPFDGFGDAFTVPLGAGAMFKVNEKMAVGGNFFFLNLLGSNGGADARALGGNFVWHN